MTLADEPVTERSFRTVFARALRGTETLVVPAEGAPWRMPLDDWVREADGADRAMLDHCVGATIDIGCGPGRLAARLRAQGHVVLGIDVVHEAVGQTRDRGVSAVCRDVFGPVPGESTWDTALLADGNLGIGGDPVPLLRRVAGIVRPGGRVVVEVEGPGVAATTFWATLECENLRSRPFRWSVVGVDAIGVVAHEAGLSLCEVHERDRRWWAVLRAPDGRFATSSGGTTLR